MRDLNQIVYAGQLAVRHIRRSACDEPLHTHPEIQLTLPLGQEAVVAHPGENRRFRLGRGSSHLTLPDQPHRYQWSSPARLLNLYFSEEALQSMAAELKKKPDQLAWDRVQEDPRLCQLAGYLAQEFEYPETPCPVLVEAVGWHILSALLCGPQSGGKAYLPARVVHRVSDYVQAHLSQTLELKVLAEVGGYSPFYFCRAFRKTVGISLHQYVICQRVRRARILLSTSSWPLRIVAAQSGFCSASHLVEVFRRWTGLTPQQYRASSPDSTR